MNSQNKKIAFFIPSLAGGGAERIWLILSNCLVELGYAVDLVLAKAEGPYLEQVSSSIQIVNLNSSRTVLSVFPLAKYLREEKPYVMFSALNHANLIALIAHRIAKSATKLYVSVHCFLSLDVQNCERKRERLIPFLIRCFYPWASGVIAVSRGVADELINVTHLSKDLVEVIHNPVVTDELIEKAQLAVDHPWLKDKDVPVVLGVGRLIEQKDFVSLIKAFMKLQETQPSRLIILGEGNERAKLEALVQKFGLTDKVDLPGFVTNPYSNMAHADVFVLSSAWEGLPTVLIEALATGTPVVSTDCKSGPDEILENGKFGNLSPVGNIQELAKSIHKTLMDPTDSNLLIRRAFDFSEETIISKYLQLI